MAFIDVTQWFNVRIPLQHQRSLTSQEVTILQNELQNDPTNRGYKTGGGFKSANDICLLLNDPYSIANPAQQGTIAKTSIAKGDLETALIGHLGAVITLQAMNQTPTVQIFCETYKQKLTAFQNSSLSEVALAGSLLGDLQLMKANGIISDADILAYTTSPDPSYQAQLPQPSRASVLLGVIVLPDEITSALA